MVERRQLVRQRRLRQSRSVTSSHALRKLVITSGQMGRAIVIEKEGILNSRTMAANPAKYATVVGGLPMFVCLESLRSDSTALSDLE